MSASLVSGYGRETIFPNNEALEFDEAKRKYFRMGSMENPNWILDCSLIDEMPVSGADFGATDNAALFWQSPGFDGSSSVPRFSFFLSSSYGVSFDYFCTVDLPQFLCSMFLVMPRWETTRSLREILVFYENQICR